MNILAITKFPPIQGGESNKAFYLFNELGRRGHEISVLTNSEDVSELNRSSFSDSDYHFLHSNPALKIHNVRFEALPNFIPQFDPKTEKLINEGIKIISQKEIDLIYGWYFLPYVSAAYLLSKMFSIPYVIQHAGSDLKRILPMENTNRYFKKIINESSGILTYSSSVKYFQDKPKNDLLLQKPSFSEIYSPVGRKIDFEVEFNIKCNPNSTFLCLGKFSKAKGFYEVIEAFRSMNNATLVMFCSNKKNIKIELPKNVFLLDAVAPWRVPEIIRNVKAMIVPEWNFGVEIHKSRLPIESVLCGKTALVSKQVIDNYLGLKQFMIPIETPNVNDIISKVQYLIQNEFINDNIFKQNEKIKNYMPTFSDYVGEVEQFLKDKIIK